MAYLFHIKIKKIMIYPFGGVSKFDMPYNISPYKEFLILIMGPFFQIIGFRILCLIDQNIELVRLYHYVLLVFNLLPIYPLDGGKLLKIIFDFYLPYKQSLQLIIYISFCIIIISFLKINPFQGNHLFIGFLLMSSLIKERNKIKIIYDKFLLERYLYQYRFYKVKKIEDKDYFYRNRYHLIKRKGNWMSEKTFLQTLFQQKEL